MKYYNYLSIFLITVSIFSCRKEPVSPQTQAIQPPDSFPETHVYSSMEDFHIQNGAAMQTYMIDAATGGSFTTLQGTEVIIPSGAFITNTNQIATGTITIHFKDIYKKSDMLLTNIIPQAGWYYDIPLLSAGEFFISASSHNEMLHITPGKEIKVKQPFLPSQNTNIAMDAFAFVNDTLANGWWNSQANSVSTGLDGYIFSLYQFDSEVDSGAWCNSDNSSFFAAYSQTHLTLIPNDNPDDFAMDVFLIFNDFNSMVHLYRDSQSTQTFSYLYAPLGFKCTIVAIGIKDHNLYSSFVPITTTQNLQTKFSLSKTTTAEFKKHLEELN